MRLRGDTGGNFPECTAAVAALRKLSIPNQSVVYQDTQHNREYGLLGAVVVKSPHSDTYASNGNLLVFLRRGRRLAGTAAGVATHFPAAVRPRYATGRQQRGSGKTEE